MSFRTDVQVDWEKSPRIVEVTGASSELSMQDLADTARGLEHRPNPGFDVFAHEYLVDLTGKQPLGGGVNVGITLTLKNGQVAFQRTGSRCSGSVTTGDTGGVSLIDSSATFETDGVQRGDWVINFVDQSVTEVIVVVSQTELTCRPLSDGTDNQFDIGDTYKVWEVQECDLSGGNAVAFDELGGTINPLFTAFGRFATRTSASSATLQELEMIQFASFQGGVWVDSTSSNTGDPLGNREFPINNIAGATAIAVERGFKKLYFTEKNWTIGATDDVTGYVIQGIYHDRSVCTLETGVNVTDVQFNQLSLQGDAGNNFCVLEDCAIRNLDNFDGNVYRSELGGTIKINLGIYRHWIRCTSNQNIGIPVIDFQGITQDLILTGYTGDLKIINLTGGSFEFYCQSANVEIDSSCTGGTITLYGLGRKTDNSTGTTVVSDAFIEMTGLNDQESTMLNHFYHTMCRQMVTNPTTGMCEIYDEHGVKVMEGAIWEDAAGTIPYRGRGVERRDPLMPVP